MTKKLKPPPIPRFAYQGGKGKLAKDIIRLLPMSGKRFIEPFAGRGNVYFHVAQRLDYKEFWLNDHYMYRFLEALQHSMHDGMEWTVPERAETNKEFYDFLKQMAEKRVKKEKPGAPIGMDRRYRPVSLPNGKKAWAVEQYPPLFVIECFLSRDGGTFDSDMRSPTDTKGVSAKGFMKNIRLAYEIMNRTQPRITYYDYKDVLVECGPDDVVYLDPPYKDRNVSAYPNDTLNHGEMIEILLRARFKWVLSEYEHPIYKPLTERFGEPERIDVTKDMGKVRDGEREHEVECLWKKLN